MKKTMLALALALLGAALSGAAFAHGHRSHFRFGVHIGVPIGWYAWHYPPPYYYYPPQVVVVPAAPQTYIEQPAPQPAPQGYWYWCAGSQAYYPYVRECPGGWQRVAPAPPPG